MADRDTGISRRAFLRAGAALLAVETVGALSSLGQEKTAGAGSPLTLPDENKDLCPRNLSITDAKVAKKLLETKMDAALFQPKVMDKIHQTFPDSAAVPDWLLRIWANAQIKNAVADYMKGDWAKTWESLEYFYRRRVSHRFEEHFAPDYAKTLVKLQKAEPAISAIDLRDKANAQYKNVQDLLGCTMGCQLGREKMDSEGKVVAINNNWNDSSLSLWDRPMLPFPHMFDYLGINPSPFVITKADHRAAMIAVHKEADDDAKNVPAIAPDIRGRASLPGMQVG